MINGNLEFTKTDFMQYRDLEISLEWHIIQLQELKENYKMRKVDDGIMNIAYMQENVYECNKASLEKNISDLTMKLFVIRRTIAWCKECVEENLFSCIHGGYRWYAI